jgi:hypothetical protein
VTAVDKNALLAPRLGEGEHEVPGVGTVRLRGLSRAEVLEARTLADTAAADRFMVSRALLDPKLTEAEVATWAANSGPKEIEDLTGAIVELSGMGTGAAKSGVPRVSG